MGYKTKSMVYAKSLKTGLHLTSDPGSSPDDMLNQKMEADKAKVSDKIDITGGMTTDIKNGTESLIKKTPEKKERTKREKGKPATKGVDSGVLSGLAGNKGTQTGTALGIIFNKIRANKVSDEKSESSKKEASNGSSTTSTGFGLNKGFDAKTNVTLSDKFNKAPGKPDFSKKNTNIPNTATKPSSSDLSKMALGSQKRIDEYKKRNWAMDATTGGAAKKDKKKVATGNAATENSLKNQKSIGKPGSSNVNFEEKSRLFPKGVGTGTAKDPIKLKNVETNNATKNLDLEYYYKEGTPKYNVKINKRTGKEYIEINKNPGARAATEIITGAASSITSALTNPFSYPTADERKAKLEQAWQKSIQRQEESKLSIEKIKRIQGLQMMGDGFNKGMSRKNKYKK